MKFGKAESLLRKIIFITLFALLLTGVFCGFSLSVAAEQPAATYNIRSSDDLITYSQAYASGERNPNDVLNISISSGSAITDSTFISLGTSSRPFSGTLIIPTAGIDTFCLSDCPLFDYVTTDLKIIDAGRNSATIKLMRAEADEVPADGVLTSGALFANLSLIHI